MSNLSPKMSREKEMEVFKKLIANKKILVADPSATARSGAFRVFCELGVKPFQILLASSFQNAQDEIKTHKPEIVLSEFSLGLSCGLDLLPEMRAASGGRNLIFILLTSDTSQSAVARAAEEDVDAYLLKPFTPDVLRRTIIKTALIKLNPPAYLSQIEMGKEFLTKGNPESAEKHFADALKLDDKPALACYYLGVAKAKRQVYEQAKEYYAQGLQYNRIHYKCLIGMYELMLTQKRNAEAYEMAKRISQYFPANPKRLTEVLKLAVINASYEDIEKYYSIFLNIEERTDTLINHMSAALVICGKAYLKTGNRSRSLDVFQKAAITCAGKTKILREIVQALIDHKLGDDASIFLKRFPPEAQKTAEYRLLDFQAANIFYSFTTVLNKGRELQQAGIHSERFYEIMIQRSIEGKHYFAAGNLVHEAMDRYPEARTKFEPFEREIQALSQEAGSQKQTLKA